MGASNKIKVDTEQLRILAKVYIARSGVVNDTWNSTKLTLDGIVRRMPAYDGRLQKAANQDVLDFTLRSRDFFTFFQDDSASLIKISEDFEIIDGQTVQILQDAQITTRASLIDSEYDLGLSTQITETKVVNPDGSISTITVVRTINADGSVTYRTTIATVLVLDAETAKRWNDEKSAGELVLGIVVMGALGLASGGLAAEIGFAAGASPAAISLANKGAGLLIPGAAKLIVGLDGIYSPDRGWQAGDTITSTTTIVTTEPIDTPDTPIPETSPLGPDITTTKVVTDKNGIVISEDTTGIDPSGALK
ncbi:MAG: hypothetical protein JW748_09495 [Anaerolineales bacterium]|nr:hypothetical protein [Anaerolineales bacterium]